MKGVTELIESMKFLALGCHGVDSAIVEGMAKEIVSWAPSEAPLALREWVNSHVRRPFSPAREMLLSPEQMVREIAKNDRCDGDTDEAAALLAALGLSVGLEAQFVLVAFDGQDAPSYVFTRLKRFKDDWENDPTMKSATVAVIPVTESKS